MKKRKLKKMKSGEVTYFTIFFVLVLNILIAALLFFFSIQITTNSIRNGAKMELNNLSASISSDTYHALRESNIDAYMAQLYSSNTYRRKLIDDFKRGLAARVALKTDDYTLQHVTLEFQKIDRNRIKYVFSCDAQFYVHVMGTDYPTINQQISLSGYHDFKFN